MRKISLIPYKLADGEDKKVPDGKGGVRIERTPDTLYDVRGHLVMMLFSRPLPPIQLREHDKIARKIEAAGGDDLLLEETEHKSLKEMVESFNSFYRGDLEFITRVTDAPEIDANTPSTGGN